MNPIYLHLITPFRWLHFSVARHACSTSGAFYSIQTCFYYNHVEIQHGVQKGAFFATITSCARHFATYFFRWEYVFLPSLFWEGNFNGPPTMHFDGKTYDKPWDDTGFIWSKYEQMTIFADKASPASCPEWERSPWCTSESPAGVRVSQQRVLGGSGMLGVWGNALGGNVGSSYNQNLLKTDEVWTKLANGLKTLNTEYILYIWKYLRGVKWHPKQHDQVETTNCWDQNLC